MTIAWSEHRYSGVIPGDGEGDREVRASVVHFEAPGDAREYVRVSDDDAPEFIK